MKVERLDRVVIDVKNLGDAVRLFSDVLGTTFYKCPADDPKTEIIMREQADRLLDKRKLEIAHSPIGVELLETVPPAEKEGLRSFSFKVSDLEEAKAEMKKKGVRILTEIRHGGLKEAILHPDDVHGARIILVEYEGPFILDAILGEGRRKEKYGPVSCSARHNRAKT